MIAPILACSKSRNAPGMVVAPPGHQCLGTMRCRLHPSTAGLGGWQPLDGTDPPDKAIGIDVNVMGMRTLANAGGRGSKTQRNARAQNWNCRVEMVVRGMGNHPTFKMCER